MRIVYDKYGIDIELSNERPFYLCLEAPDVYRETLNQLWLLANGDFAELLISIDGKEISVQKKAELIFNPFGINFNDRKLSSRLINELAVIAANELYEETSELNTLIINYLDSITNKIPYPIEFDIDLDIIALAKAYKVRFEDTEESFATRLISYCKLVHRVCGTELFILSNLKQYLVLDELWMFYEELKYENICILDIEGKFNYKLQKESCMIVDKDKCNIVID